MTFCAGTVSEKKAPELPKSVVVYYQICNDTQGFVDCVLKLRTTEEPLPPGVEIRPELKYFPLAFPLTTTTSIFCNELIPQPAHLTSRMILCLNRMNESNEVCSVLAAKKNLTMIRQQIIHVAASGLVNQTYNMSCDAIAPMRKCQMDSLLECDEDIWPMRTFELGLLGSWCLERHEEEYPVPPRGHCQLSHCSNTSASTSSHSCWLLWTLTPPLLMQTSLSWLT
ncbi:uncharacterized protein LOC101854261 [Aplysia californica]|uniref:Uncharacterized protein LOC101854261 n=1 Tax=Aplysia californica TaxID=6500 RepID=A0ABM1A1P4_APLCA|nr:uncharacterized protein LOC101854261 [Aplysia californica]